MSIFDVLNLIDPNDQRILARLDQGAATLSQLHYALGLGREDLRSRLFRLRARGLARAGERRTPGDSSLRPWHLTDDGCEALTRAERLRKTGPITRQPNPLPEPAEDDRPEAVPHPDATDWERYEMALRALEPGDWIPSPLEIGLATKRIRDGWCQREEWSRRGLTYEAITLDNTHTHVRPNPMLRAFPAIARRHNGRPMNTRRTG